MLWSNTAKPSPAALKIMVAGGHPGDPECGCAGTIARYTELGHEVVLLYLNRGEGYCGGANLARYPVLTEGGWWDATKCQDCLARIDIRRAGRMGSLSLLSDDL